MPAIISSLACAIFIAVAAIAVNEPRALMLLAVASFFAWLSHQDEASPKFRNFMVLLGLLSGFVAFILVVLKPL